MKSQNLITIVILLCLAGFAIASQSASFVSDPQAAGSGGSAGFSPGFSSQSEAGNTDAHDAASLNYGSFGGLIRMLQLANTTTTLPVTTTTTSTTLAGPTTSTTTTSTTGTVAPTTTATVTSTTKAPSTTVTPTTLKPTTTIAPVTTTTSTTTTTLPKPSITIRINGKEIASGDVIPANPTFAFDISSPVEVTELTVTLGNQQIYHATQRFFQKVIQATAANLEPGKYDLKVELVNGLGQSIIQEIKGLRVEKTEEILDLQTSVIAGTPLAPATIKMNFQASGTGPVTILLVDSGPPPKVLIEQTINVDVGRNEVTLEMISNTGAKITKGAYQWKMVFKGAVRSGNIIVP